MKLPQKDHSPSQLSGEHRIQPRRANVAVLERLFQAGLLVTVLLLASCAEVPNNVAPRKAANLVFPAAPDEPHYYLERILHSSADIVPDEENGALKRLVTGTGKSGEGLAKPFGIAVHNGRIYVADSGDRVVKVFDVPGKRFFKVGDEDGQGMLRSPLGVATDGDGNVYVVDGTYKEVKIYDKEGKFLRVIGKKDDIYRPAGIAVDKEGKRIYVVDVGGVQSTEHHIRVFDAHTGQHLLDIGKRGDKDGELNLPRDVAIGPDGLLYVVDGGNFRVEVFKTDGTFVSSFGGIGNRGGQFSRPKGIAIDPNNYAYVVDTAFGNFQIFSPKGELMLAIGGRSETDEPAAFMLPAGIASDQDGRIYVVDQFFRKVEIYRPAALKEGTGQLYGTPTQVAEKPATQKTLPADKPEPQKTPAVSPADPKG